MTRTLKIMVVLGVILILAGVTGSIFGKDVGSSNDKNNFIVSENINAYRQNMMNSTTNENTNEKLTEEEIRAQVNEYINSVDSHLEIQEIVESDENGYEVSVINKDTGVVAMELFVNPYTGEVYPEFCIIRNGNSQYSLQRGNMPNGMMGGNRSRMGRNGMMDNRN